MNIIFDLGGVYFNDGLKLVITRVAAEYRIDQQDVAFVLNGKFSEKYRKGIITPWEFWKNAKEYWETKVLYIDRIKQIFFNSYIPQENVKAYVRELRIQGHKVGYISNNPEDRAKFLDQKYEVTKEFDFGLFSYQAKSWKPERAIYEKLIADNNLDIKKTIFVDQLETNLITVREIGGGAIKYEDIEQLRRSIPLLINN